MTHHLPRSGHSSGRLRDAFAEAMGQSPGPVVTPELYRLAGQLWSCTDTVPAGYCDDLDLPRGNAYAQAARAIRKR